MPTLSAKVSQEDFDRYQEMIDRIGCSQSDFVRRAADLYDSVMRYTGNGYDWVYKELSIPPPDARTEGSESKDTYDLDQIPSRKAVKVTIHEKRVI